MWWRKRNVLSPKETAERGAGVEKDGTGRLYGMKQSTWGR